jgi:putative ABC transport system permease protein
MHFPLIAGSALSLSLLKLPDLSLETAFVCGALISSKIMLLSTSVGTISVGLAGVSSLLAGSAVGLCSSLLTTQLAIAHLLSAILTFGIFQAGYHLSGTYVSLAHVSRFAQFIPLFQAHADLALLMIIFSACSALVFFFYQTELAYAMAFYGMNPRMLKFYRINQNFVIITGLIIANALAGFSGFLVAQTTGFADSAMGYGKILICITSILLGKLIYQKNHFSFFVPLAGSAAYFALQQFLIQIGINLNYFSAVQATIIIILLAFRSSRLKQNTDFLGV